MAKPSPLDRLGRVAPILRGLLAESTSDDDFPQQPPILNSFTDAKSLVFAAKGKPIPPSFENIRSEPLRLKALSDNESDQTLVARIAESLADYEREHNAKPELICLPKLAVFHATQPSAAPGHDPRLVGRTAVVTGAAGAIGYGICHELLERGCHVAITDLPGKKLDDFVAEFRADCGSVTRSTPESDRILGIGMDVTDAASVARSFAEISAKWGGVDIVVINAGIALTGPLAEIDLEAFRKLERVNVEGTLLALAEAARHFARQNIGGDVILISTKNVFAPGAGFGAYSATKAAAHQLARIASLEFAPMRVRVNMVSPDAVFSGGNHRSGLWAAVGPSRMKARGLDEKGLAEYYRNRNLLKAKVTAKHVARAVLFFALRETPTTGACIPVDGGLPDAAPR